MSRQNRQSNLEIIKKLMLRLLPVQILLAIVGSVNGIVSAYFATNYVGLSAMSAVGLYGPINMLIGTCSTILCGGSAIICGKYLGQNEQKKLQNVFSVNIVCSIVLSAVFILFLLALGLLDLSVIFTTDTTIRPIFNRYLLGQTIGVLPMIIGGQLPVFLALENRGRRTLAASITYIVANLLFNLLFVQMLDLEELGISLASSFGMWFFLAVQAGYFLSAKSFLKFRFRNLNLKELAPILKIGFPGAAVNLYQTVRGLIVNHLLETFVGSAGLSAFAASNNLMGFFWAIPGGMIAVSRLLISVSVGEEDRQTLTDIIRVMFRYYIPMMLLVDVGIILGAPLLTRLFFQDPTQPVFQMTADGFRILPLCMSFSIICMHFTCIAQNFNRQGFVNILAFLDGVVCVAFFSWILIGPLGINAVYLANVLNGVVCTFYILGYAWVKNRHLPKTMSELLVIPASFGAQEENRIDLSIRTLEEVGSLSEKLQLFCREKGIDEKRAFLASLAMEEMSGNVVEHGFTKDTRKHTVDVRVTYKDEAVILRIRDDCIPFNPEERQAITSSDDITKNIGIRMIYKMANDIHYQNLLGLNVLTIKI